MPYKASYINQDERPAKSGVSTRYRKLSSSSAGVGSTLHLACSTGRPLPQAVVLRRIEVERQGRIGAKAYLEPAPLGRAPVRL